MDDPTIDALHEVHIATNDVLTGYKTMLERAGPEIQPIIAELTPIHGKHAAALEARLSALGDGGKLDSALCRTTNTGAVTMRDWIAGLDEGSLDAVERGESALQGIYKDARDDFSAANDPETATLLDRQYHEASQKIETLAAR